MQAAVGVLIEPDAWQKFELLISRNSLVHKDQPFRKYVPGKFFTRLITAESESDDSRPSIDRRFR